VPCGHHTCGECFQKLLDPTRAIREGNENSTPKCPHCRGTLSSEKITDYRHFCKVFCPNKYEELRRAFATDGGDEEGEESDDSDVTDISDDEDDEDTKDPTLGGFIVDDDDVDEDVKMEDDGESSAAAGRGRGRKKGKGKAKVKVKVKEHLTLAQLKKLSLRNTDAKKRYMRRLQKSFKSSAKIDETVRLLTDIRENDPTEKTLIFSSFTTLLDLLEVPLQKEKFNYQRYDGSMNFDDRIDAVNEFMDKSTENIMLISIKAGNAGLNLNKASQVIMLDPFWVCIIPKT
jgi:SNF2 family DNA or RNA helicase